MAILPQVKHVVVVMLENRSFDDICGWLYQPGTTPQPSQFLPPSSPKEYDGLKSTYFNPVNAQYFKGQSAETDQAASPTDPDETFQVADHAASPTDPNPDPEETFSNVTYQLFGPEKPSANPTWPNMGFVINYANATGHKSPVDIMKPFNPAQLPVISSLAANFAVSDRYFCSIPSQTWPNRSFMHAGTSNGNVNNGDIPNPFDWDVRNIFNVLEDVGADWRIYSDTELVPPLTRVMFPNLWVYDDHFLHFDDFKQDCASGKLAQYTFLEPSFVVDPNDEHPPHDVVAGEKFLHDIWQAVSQSPAWPETLLMITYDEHGGTYDHVHPPFGAASPDAKSNPGQEGFTFDRFGVRVPCILISPWIQAGTVFRSPTATPYDHTSLLATLRDWLSIPKDKMLTSARIAAAPTFEQVLNLQQARTDIPNIPPPAAEAKHTDTFKEPNSIQKSLVSAHAVQLGKDPAAIMKGIQNREDAIHFFKANPWTTPH
ncbi:phosphoesterase family protein [Rhizodiscina lignyota]|uniref:Phosphoesterase family protein n=1 Tax=Rhizodiscina lignyota TaxID=1504668 RepID=A0A9P4MAV3_9PEZI|nr:phosphoesterase family protein [Rhizodiscina lignyota]